MLYSEYGNTGKQVSAIGFGGMRFNTKERTNSENAEIVLYAQEKGINFFDTAPFYCDDKSESILGLAFQQITAPRDSYFVSTKANPIDNSTSEKGITSVKRSLEKLKLDYIDFFHVWCIRSKNNYDLAMKKGGLYEGLLKCKEEGLIRHIAISTHMPGNEIEDIIKDGNFEGVLMGVNILNFTFRWNGVVAAHNAGLGVVAMNPLAGGIIPAYEKQLEFLTEPDESPTEAAIRFLVSAPQINVALVGFSDKEQIDTACKVPDKAKPFSQTDIDKIKRKISQNMDVLCTSCGYCEKSCPVNIPIPRFMQFYNEKLFCNRNEKEMIGSLNFNIKLGILVDIKAGADECTKCGKCEEICTQHLNIIERLEEIAVWKTKINTKKNKHG